MIWQRRSGYCFRLKEEALKKAGNEKKQKEIHTEVLEKEQLSTAWNNSLIISVYATRDCNAMHS
jgi:hypothetical protein